MGESDKTGSNWGIVYMVGTLAASLAVIGSFVLAFFGVKLLIKGKFRHLKGWLMLIAAFVLLMNVFLLTQPVPL